MAEVKKLIEGYKSFYQNFFKSDTELYKELSTVGQSPKTLIISCSDSRVDPAILTQSSPGDIFVIRNVANMVPPFEDGSNGLHGVSAAIEFAVRILGVKHIVIVGHSQCAGIKALIDSTPVAHTDFIAPWVGVGKPARERAFEKSDREGETRDIQTLCECEGVVNSLENLMTFPWIKDKVEAKELSLHGWYFPVDTGVLEAYDSEADAFRPVA